MIVAMAKNRGIGLNGDMPWGRGLPADLAHFKKVTMGCPIIMGRKTWDSIGRALPGRINLVVSRQALDLPEGVVLSHSLEEAFDSVSSADKVFVIGGAQLYEQALPLASELHITEVDAEPEADTYFPELNPVQWNEVERVNYKRDSQNQYDCAFIKLLKAC